MLTVIIPVYNVQTYLEECICSVTQQFYCDLEIILVDDGSTDHSNEMCDEWRMRDERIRVIHKQNGGLSSARNAGLDLAKGDYITFLDSDDFIAKSMYADLLSVFDKNPDVDVACCGIEQFRDEDHSISNQFLNLHNQSFTSVEYWKMILLHKIDNSVCNKLYRNSIIRNVRFREGVINEDILFNLEIMQNISRLIYIPDTYYKYRLRTGSITCQANPQLFDFIENAFFIQKILLEKMKYLLKRETEGYIYHEMTNCISTVEKYRSANEYRQQINYCKKYIVNRPVKSFGNNCWSLKQKIKFILVSYFPTLYRYMLKR